MPKIIEFLGYDPSVGDRGRLRENPLHYRKSRGMTQKELAKRIGIDPATLGRLEKHKGRCFPSLVEKVNRFMSEELNPHS